MSEESAALDDMQNCKRLLDRFGSPGYCDTTVYFRLSVILQTLKEITRERDAMWQRIREMEQGAKP